MTKLLEIAFHAEKTVTFLYILPKQVSVPKMHTNKNNFFYRDDLRYWLMENREDLKMGDPEVIEKHSEIRETVNSVKTQQKEIMDKLQHEQRCLEMDLASGTRNVYFSNSKHLVSFLLDCLAL